MKKEASGKKGKLWLWIVIAVVLIGAIVAGIIFLPGLLNKDNADDTGLNLYWNVDRVENTDRDTGLSIRQPAEDGNYYVRFAHNGKQVEIPVADKKLVNYIDSLDLMGLSLDENGFVVDIFPVKDIASVIGESLYVQSVSGDTIIANSSIMMNGRKITIKLNDELAIYNVSGKGEFVGEKLDATKLNPMDTISIYGALVPEDSEEDPVPTHIFVLKKPAESKIYFRADQFYDSSTKSTTREPDENGAYTIKWYCEGEIVELKCKDKAMVSTVDSSDPHWCHWGLEFDEDGYIVELLDSFLGSRTLMQCERFDITEIDDAGNYVATSLIKNNGAFVQGTVGADCPIYDISSTAKSEGQDNRKVDSLKLGDRVCIWTDTMGNPVQIYVTRRQAECDYYWVVTRSYSSTTKLTTRTPNENGFYEIELLKAGDTKNTMYYTKDVNIATAVDYPSDRVVGLKVAEGNIIEYVYDLQAVFGNTYFVRDYYVLDATGSVATFLSPAGSGYTKNGVVAAGAKVWNVSTVGKYGEETTLQIGDTVKAGKTPIGELSYAYVIRRIVNNGENKFYWRIDDRQYDSKAKETTRTPDAEGYYTYLFAHNGKQVTLKTKNKDFATALDAQSSAPAFTLETSGDIITKVHEGTYSFGGSRYNGWTVDAVNGNEIEVTSSSGTKGTWDISEAKIYNVSNSHTSHKGEQIYSVKVGDVVANYRDINCTPKIIIVKTRETNKMAWPVAPQYSSDVGTLRTPNEKGWYTVDLAVDGKIRTYTVKSKAVMDAIDAYSSPFGIEVKGDEILYMSTTTYVENVKGSGLTTYTVQSVSGSTVKAIYTPGSADNAKTGVSEEFTMSANVKIYDVSDDARLNGTFGQAVKLKKNDVIRTYTDNDGNHLYVFVIAHGTRDYYSYCAHCEKMVYWTPYVPSSNFVAFDSHYYLATDVALTAQMRVYSTARNFEVVLDLNGHNAHRDGGRAGLIRYGDTLTIIDTVGGGKITTKNNTSNGGVFMLSGDSTNGPGVINLYKGTLTVVPSDEPHMYAAQGGIITNSGGIINMYGGEIKDGIVYGKTSAGAVGGNIRISSGGAFNMFGGVVSGGQAFGGTYQAQVKDAEGNKLFDEQGNPVMETLLGTGSGGNIYMESADTTVTIDGGIIKDGKAGRGGNVTVGNGKFTLVNGSVTDGTVAATGYGKSSDGRGGNIFNNGDVYIKGGAVTGGTIIDGYSAGGNIMSTGTADTIFISGDAVVTGGINEDGENDNIYLMYSNLVISGGTVNVPTENGTNIYAYGYTAGASNVTVSGGNIDRILLTGGSVDAEGNDTRCTLTLSGGRVGHLDASSCGKIAVSGNPVVDYMKPCGAPMEVGEMTKGAAVTLDAVGIFSGENTPNAQAVVDNGYFKPYDTVMKVGVTAKGELKIYHPDATAGYCEHCDGEADWMPWTGTAAANGHYFMTGDVQLTEELILASGAEMVLDLKGYTVTAAENTRVFNTKGDLVVMDSSEAKTGTITGGRATRGGNIYVNSGASFYLLSGTVTGGVADNDLGTSSSNGRGGNIFSNGQVVLMGGVVSDGKATNGSGYGGNICSTGLTAELIVMGDAVVTGGSAKTGGNVNLMYSNLMLAEDGVITSGTATTGENVYASGTASGGHSSVAVAGGTITDGTVYLSGGVGEVDGVMVNYGTALAILGGNLDCTVNAVKIADVIDEDGVNYGSVVALSGNPVIKELKLGDGVKIAAAELTEGAKIALNASGVVSIPYADATLIEGYIASEAIVAFNSNMDKLIVNENGELVVTSKHEMSTETFFCEHCGQEVEFTSLFGNSITAAGHYYLVDDLNLTDVVNISSGIDVVINLNGHKVTAASGLQAFNVSGNLGIMDSSADKSGVVTGGSAYRGGNIYVNNKANFTLYSGSILNGLSDSTLGTGTTGGRGGNIFGNGGNVTLKGGVVAGGTVVNGSEWGGNIFMTGGLLTVEDGAVISGGKASTGGNVYLMYAAMVMTGGEIKDGNAKTGNGVYLRGSGAGYSSLDISGGIIDGKVMNYEAESTITVSGNAQIAELAVKGLLNVGELTEGASIKVAATEGAFTDVLANANAVVGYFDAVDAAYNVAVSADGKLEIVNDPTYVPPVDPDAKEVFCPHCGQTVLFSAWDGTAENGHFYLTESVELTKSVSVGSEKNFVLDLNGMTITANGERAFYVSGGATLSIVDTVGNGVITGGNSKGGRGGNIYASGGNVKLYGGTIVNGTAAADGNQEGHNVAVYNGEFVMNGNVVIGDADKDGHSVYLFNAKSVELVKGTINGKALLRSAKGLTLPSAVYVDLFAMRDSNFAVVEERNDGKLIAIKITNGAGEFLTGAFTSALDNAQAALAYFKAANEEQKIIVNGDGKLEVVSAKEPEPPVVDPEANCEHCQQKVEWIAWDGVTIEGGHYILQGNVELADRLTIKSDMVIDLNGYTITAAADKQAFQVNKKLSILDTSEAKTGTITGGKALNNASTYTSRGGNFVVGGGELNIYGGNIVGGQALSRGGNIYATGNAVVNIYGGVITGGAADTHANNIYVNYSTLNIYGGVIENTVDNDIYNVRGAGYNGAFTNINIYGGKITGAAALRADDDLAKVTISGGEIEGTTYMSKVAEFKIEGKPVIGKLTLIETLVAVGELTEGASIKVNATEGIITDVLANADAVVGYFDAVNAAYNVAVNAEGKLEIVADASVNPPEPPAPPVEPEAREAFCAHCGQIVAWTEFDGTVADGHFYLTENVTRTESISIASGKDFVLDLNGMTITADGCRAFYVGGGATLSIVDTVGTGVVTGGNSNGARGGNIYATGGNVKLYGGTFVGGTATADGNNEGHNIAVYNGEFVLNGNVTIGDVDKEGHSLYLFNLKAVELVKGNVLGKALLRGVKGWTLCSEFNADLLALRDSKIAAVEERTNKITVKVTNAAGDFLMDVFTDVLTNAETALTYFTSAMAETEIIVNADGKLQIAAIVPELPIEPCPHCEGAGWVAWDGQTTSGHYFLSDNVQLSDVITIAKETDVVIDLKGFTITAAENVKAFDVAGKLSIVDTSEAKSGVITGGSAYRGGNVYVQASGEFTLYAGSIIGGVADTALSSGTTGGRGGNIFGNGGNVTLKGGVVAGGSTVSGSNWGGNIFMTGGTLTVEEGAVISGGSAKAGSNIYLMYADMILNGAEISGATGTAVYMNGTATAGYSNLTINGAVIDGTLYSNNVANVINLSGNVQIGFLDLNGTLINVGELTDGTAIAVDALGVFTNKDVPNAKDVAQKGYFTTDKDNMIIGATSKGELKVYNADAVVRYCEHCADEADWMEWTGDKAVEGHYFLTSDVVLTDELELAADNLFVLDLNGHIIMAADGKRCFDVYGEMYVLDSSETKVGTITGGTATRGGNIYVNADALFCLVDGNITNGIADNALGTSTNNGRGGNIFAGGKVVLMGGTVSGGVATTGTGVGGNICVTGGSLTVMGDAVVTGGSAKSAGNVYLMYGDLVLADQAEISEGTANSGANIYASGTESGGASSITIIGGSIVDGDVSMSGGQITNGIDYRTALTIMGGNLDCTINVSKVAADTVTISGAPVIAKLKLGEDVLLNISGITADAKIVVDNMGVISYPVAETDDVRVIMAFNCIIPAAKRVELICNDKNELEIVELPLATEQKYCEDCKQTVTFTEWFGLDFSANGHYYLSEDVVLDDQIAVAYNVVIDLNGYTIDASATKRAFSVSSNGVLSIQDSSEAKTGKVVGGDATIDSSSPYGGAIYVNGGTFNLYNGVVVGGVSQRGGNIYLTGNGNVNILGGTVADGVAEAVSSTTGRGGNIFLNNGTLTIGGNAVISGGEAKVSTGNSGRGGNIFLNAGEIVVAGDAQIIDGIAGKTGGNIMVYKATATIGGNAVIENGWAAEDGNNITCMDTVMTITENALIGAASEAEGVANENVYLTGTSEAAASEVVISGGTIMGLMNSNKQLKSFTVSGKPVIEQLGLYAGKLVTVGALEEGASITVVNQGVFTDVLENAAEVLAYFNVADETLEVVVNAENKLEVKQIGVEPEPPVVEPEVREAFCPHCGQNVEWTVWEGAAADGHFYLTENVTLTATVVFKSGADFVLDLNGMTITAEGCRAFNGSGGATLSIVDTVGTGVIAGGNSNGGRGGNIYASGANVKLYGGTIIGGTATNDGNSEGHNVAVYNGVFVLNGNVTIGDADKDGHSLYLFNTVSTELTKGTVVGKVLMRGVKGWTLGSEFNVDLLALRDSSFAVVEERNASEQVAIKVTNAAGEFLKGEFTSALANAETALTYFKSASEDYKIVVNADGKLELVENTAGTDPEPEDPIEPPAPPVEPEINCEHCQQNVEWVEWNGQTESGHYYLAKDEVLTAKYGVTGAGVDIVLDLRGFDMTASGVIHVIDIRDGAIVSVCDTVGGGVISGANNPDGSGGNIYVYQNGATFNLYGGTITDGSAKQRGGNIYVTSGGICNIYGGSVIGGTIADAANQGANIFIMQGALNILGDAYITNAVDGDGEAIYVYGTGTMAADFTMTAGNVEGELVLRGILNNAEISGTAKIAELNMKSSAALTKIGAFEAGATVMFGEATTGAVSVALDIDAATLAYIGTLAEDKVIVLNAENKLEVAELCFCGCGTIASEVVWEDANAYVLAMSQRAENTTTIIDNVHLKLSADLNVAEIYGAKKQISIGGENFDVVVTIDLNGFTWNGDYRMYNYAGCVLNFLDSSEAGTGTMIGTGRSLSAHGGVFVNYGTLNIYGGTFTQPAEGSLVHKGGVVYQSNGVFNLYGGTLIGGQANMSSDGSKGGLGGNVHIYNGIFNMYGGSIIGGIAEEENGMGGNVYLTSSATFNMYGGEIKDGVAANEAEIYAVEGATVNLEGGVVGTPAPIEYCACGCGAVASEVVWEDAYAYIQAMSQRATNVATIVDNVHLKLNADLDITAIYGAAKQIAIGGESADVTVTIDLNGYTWSSTDRLYNYAGCTVNLMDSSEAGTGVFTSTGNDTKSGRTVINYGTFNIFSGTITMTEEGASTKVATAGVYYQSSGITNMYGGKIVGGKTTAAGKGGNVNIRTGTFNMYGGEISGGEAAEGSNVYVAKTGTFNIEGGIVADKDTTVYYAQ